MKPTIYVTAVFLLTLGVGCNIPPTHTEWTEETKEQTKKEISARIDEIIQGANNLDVEAAIQPYANTPEFLMVNPDATVSDYPTMKHVQTEGMKALASMDFKTLDQKFTFLDGGLVMCTWTGSNELELKSGDRIKIAPYVGSMLFEKSGGQWHIIYAHETAAAPTQVSENATKELEDVFKKMWDNVTLSNAQAYFKTDVSDDFYTINADGIVQNKAQLLADRKRLEMLEILDFKFFDQLIKVYGDVAIINGRIRAFSEGKYVAEVLYTAIFVKENGVWKYKNWQGAWSKDSPPPPSFVLDEKPKGQ